VDPHVHLLTRDGGRTADGVWQPLPEWNSTVLMILFRERLLARLVEAHAISPELVKRLPPGSTRASPRTSASVAS